MCFSMASDYDYTAITCGGCHLHGFVFCKCGGGGGVLHTYRHGLASVERADRRLSLGVCRELHKSAA